MDIRYYLGLRSAPSVTRALLLLTMLFSGLSMFITISAYKNNDIEDFSTTLGFMIFFEVYLLSAICGMLGFKKNAAVLLLPYIVCRILWVIVITMVLVRAIALEFTDFTSIGTDKAPHPWLSKDVMNFSDKLRHLVGNNLFLVLNGIFLALEMHFTGIVISCYDLLKLEGNSLIMQAHFDGRENVNLIQNGGPVNSN